MAAPPGWFAVPAPVRRLFDLFPLAVYPPEPLPAAAPSAPSRPRLYLWAADEDARRGRPSLHPPCLKWQSYLRIAGLDVDLVPSNKHASSSASLPFLLPPPSSSVPRAGAGLPLTASRIAQYAPLPAPSSSSTEASSPRLEAYLALVSQCIRPAWLYALYLLPANETLVADLYLPSSPLLRPPTLHALRAAATDEILSSTRRPRLCPSQLLADARSAFASLSALLANHDWFFAAPTPGLLDAELFAYSYVLLTPRLAWPDHRLASSLASFENLVRHRTRLYDGYWPNLPDQ